MTGYQSKKKAASAKTIDEVNWVDHEPDGRRAAAQEPMQYNCTVIDDTHPNGIPLSQWGQQAPQRPWVDLTDDEILKFQDIVPNTLSYDLIEFARAVLAKSKKKNT
jgi:hypothetical protein